MVTFYRDVTEKLMFDPDVILKYTNDFAPYSVWIPKYGPRIAPMSKYAWAYVWSMPKVLKARFNYDELLAPHISECQSIDSDLAQCSNLPMDCLAPRALSIPRPRRGRVRVRSVPKAVWCRVRCVLPPSHGARAHALSTPPPVKRDSKYRQAGRE